MKLAAYTTLGLGGPAHELWTACNEEEAILAVRRAKRSGHELRILGGGSNLVVADAGVDAAVLRLTEAETKLDERGHHVLALVAAGTVWDDWVRYTVERGWPGLECLSGIPGQVGGTPIQNVGAYGQEVAETVTRLRVLDRHAETIDWLPASACAFGYRTSRFKGEDADRLLVLAVEFALPTLPSSGLPARPLYPELARALALSDGEQPSLARIRETVLALRKSKSMVLDPADENGRSCGSFFTNPFVSAADLERIATRAGEKPPSFPQADGRSKVPAHRASASRRAAASSRS